ALDQQRPDLSRGVRPDDAQQRADRGCNLRQPGTHLPRTHRHRRSQDRGDRDSRSVLAVPPLTASLLHKQIVAGDTAPLYMLVGEDDAEKSAVANEFVDMIDEGLRAFNVDRLY